MALGPFNPSLERRQAADFSIPYLITQQVILLPRPRIENDLAGFLKPFAWNVRILFIFSYNKQ